MPEPQDRPDERLRELQRQVDHLVTERARLRVDLSSSETELQQLRQMNERLLADRHELENRLERLAAQRAEVPLATLGDRLRGALVELSSQPVDEDARVDYQARAVAFELKANLAFDDEQTPVLRFPALGEKVQAHELATIQLSFDAAPRPDLDLSALVAVPSVIGLPASQAEERLAAAGLAVGQRSERESSATPGTVVAQDPVRGDYADPGTGVDLVVAVASRAEVPDVVARPIAEAVGLLRAAGFDVPAPKVVTTDKAPPDHVLDQQPPAGRREPVGTSVQLTVAAAPPRVEVPPVRGLLLAEAAAALEQAGLRRGAVGRLRSDEREGTVLRQDPAAGTAVDPGSRVDLVVAQSTIERSVPAPDVVGRRRDEAVAALIDAGWGVRRLRAAEPDADTAREGGRYGTVAAQNPVGGHPVPASQKMMTLHLVTSPAPVTEVKGVGPVAAERLAGGGVHAVGDLVVLPAEEIADLLGVPEERARALLDEAEVVDRAFGLQHIAGVGVDLAVLLSRADIRDRGELAAADPAGLARRLRQLAEQHPPGRGVQLTAAALRQVVEAARRTP